MLAIIAAGIAFIGALVLSLAKVSSRSEKITESHREELLARKKEEPEKSNEEE